MLSCYEPAKVTHPPVAANVNHRTLLCFNFLLFLAYKKFNKTVIVMDESPKLGIFVNLLQREQPGRVGWVSFKV